MVHALSVALHGKALQISDFPVRKDLIGIGLSDDPHYADRLPAKLSYRNTFYDREPRLDITDPPKELEGRLDFLIASDVFEHVPPPIERAFECSYRLLKPGGVFVLTVPYSLEDQTEEYFPNLHDWEIRTENGSTRLVNRTADGQGETFDDLHFHGGGGLTLEMRHFSHSALLRHLEDAGFSEITDWRLRREELDNGCLGYRALPIVARA